jgi:hypothetical protein
MDARAKLVELQLSLQCMEQELLVVRDLHALKLARSGWLRGPIPGQSLSPERAVT